MDLLADGISWFPQEYATLFYWTKGLIALVATLLVISHTNTAFATEVMSLGRRLRYYSLLVASIVLTGSSVEQVNEGVLVNYRNLGGMVLALFITVAMVVSIAETKRRP